MTVYRADLKSHGGKGSVLLYIHGENPFEEGCVVKVVYPVRLPYLRKITGLMTFIMPIATGVFL